MALAGAASASGTDCIWGSGGTGAGASSVGHPTATTLQHRPLRVSHTELTDDEDVTEAEGGGGEYKAAASAACAGGQGWHQHRLQQYTSASDDGDFFAYPSDDGGGGDGNGDDDDHHGHGHFTGFRRAPAVPSPGGLSSSDSSDANSSRPFTSDTSTSDVSSARPFTAASGGTAIASALTSLAILGSGVKQRTQPPAAGGPALANVNNGGGTYNDSADNSTSSKQSLRRAINLDLDDDSGSAEASSAATAEGGSGSGGGSSGQEPTPESTSSSPPPKRVRLLEPPSEASCDVTSTGGGQKEEGASLAAVPAFSPFSSSQLRTAASLIPPATVVPASKHTHLTSARAVSEYGGQATGAAAAMETLTSAPAGTVAAAPSLPLFSFGPHDRVLSRQPASDDNVGAVESSPMGFRAVGSSISSPQLGMSRREEWEEALEGLI